MSQLKHLKKQKTTIVLQQVGDDNDFDDDTSGTFGSQQSILTQLFANSKLTAKQLSDICQTELQSKYCYQNNWCF